MKNNIFTIGGTTDTIKAVRKANREMGLGNGFVAIHKVYKSKKAYDRKKEKNIFF